MGERERERERRTGMDTSGSVGRAGGIADIFLLRAENKKEKREKIIGKGCMYVFNVAAKKKKNVPPSSVKKVKEKE